MPLGYINYVYRLVTGGAWSQRGLGDEGDDSFFFLIAA